MSNTSIFCRSFDGMQTIGDGFYSEDTLAIGSGAGPEVLSFPVMVVTQGRMEQSCNCIVEIRRLQACSSEDKWYVKHLCREVWQGSGCNGCKRVRQGEVVAYIYSESLRSKTWGIEVNRSIFTLIQESSSRIEAIQHQENDPTVKACVFQLNPSPS